MENTLILDENFRSKPEMISNYRNMDIYDTSIFNDFNDIDKDVDLEHNFKIMAVTLFIYCLCFTCCYILQQRK